MVDTKKRIEGKKRSDKIIRQFVELGSKLGVRGMWVLMDDGDFYWFKDIAARHRFAITGRTQEKLLETEIEEIAFKDSAYNSKKSRDEIHKDTTYVG